MLQTLFILATSVSLAYPLFWLARKLNQWRRQRVFIRKILRHSCHDKNARLIVALSTLPDRIRNLRPTLNCLLRQTRPPNEIILFIPEFSVRQQQAYVIPEFLRELPRIKIVRVEEDWGPATKFIPVIQMELAAGRPDTLIMVVDDDRFYPRDSAECYWHYSAELPDAALCFRGAIMPRNLDWRVSRMTRGEFVRTPHEVAVITGCGSYLIKPSFFDETLWDYSNAPRAAFYMDDIWISGCLDRRGVKKFVVPSSGGTPSVRAQARTMSLHDVPGGRQPNNNELIKFFRDTWRVWEP